MTKVTHLFLSNDQIRRAAEDMLQKHGDGSLSVVTEQIGILRSEGYDSFADHWQMVYDEIARIQGSEGYSDALSRYVTLSE